MGMFSAWSWPELLGLGSVSVLGGAVCRRWLVNRKKLSHKRQVLVVEDNALSAKVVCELVERAGFAFVQVESGEAALMQADEFELILIDFELDGLDGCATTRAIRSGQGAVRSNVPVVVLTAHPAEALESVCREARANGVVTKPLTSGKLEQVLHDIASGVFSVQGEAVEPAEEEVLDVQGAISHLELSIEEYNELAELFFAGFEEKVDGIVASASQIDGGGGNERLLSCDVPATTSTESVSFVGDGSFEISDELWTELGARAHSLKGECASVGARQCFLMMEELVELAVRREPESLPELVVRLLSVSQRTMKAWASHVNDA